MSSLPCKDRLIIYSGGQTGADIAAWKAARAFGLPTGGYMVDNYVAEDGHHPEYASLYGAELLGCRPGSTIAAQYRQRALANVQLAEATICFDTCASKATANAIEDAIRYGKHLRVVDLVKDGTSVLNQGSYIPADIADWIRDESIGSLNVAGNRSSKAPGIERYVLNFMSSVFWRLGLQSVTK